MNHQHTEAHFVMRPIYYGGRLAICACGAERGETARKWDENGRDSSAAARGITVQEYLKHSSYAASPREPNWPERVTVRYMTPTEQAAHLGRSPMRRPYLKENTMFGRENSDGSISLFHADGRVVTRLVNGPIVYPIGDSKSVRYEHPEGVVVSADDAVRLGIEVES
jgi:hypothetical protein